MLCKFGQLPFLQITGSTTGASRKTSVGEAMWLSIQGEAKEKPYRRAGGVKRRHSFSVNLPSFRKTSSPVQDMTQDRPESRTRHPKKDKKNVRSSIEHIRETLLTHANMASCRTVGDVSWASDGCPFQNSETVKQQSQDLAQRWMYPSNSLDQCVAEDLAELLSTMLPGSPQGSSGDGKLAHLSYRSEASGGVKKAEDERLTETTHCSDDRGVDTCSVCTSVESLTDASEVDAKELWLQRRAKRRQRRKEAAKLTYGAVIRGEHEQFLTHESPGKDDVGTGVVCN